MRRTISQTKKSSCVNARGIPIAAYQVYTPSVTRSGVPLPARGTPQPGVMGVYPRWGTHTGVPLARSDRGVPEVRYPQQGYPPARSNGGVTRGGVPPARSDGEVPEVGYPPGKGIPWSGLIGGYRGGVLPWQAYPWPGLAVGYPRWGTPPSRGTPQPGLMGGVPQLDLAGYPPPVWTWPWYPPPTGVDRLETLPSLILRMRSVINPLFTPIKSKCKCGSDFG